MALKQQAKSYLWNLEDPKEWEDISRFIEVHGCVKPEEAIFIELFADMEVRRERNVHPERLEKKPSKRNIELSTYLLDQLEKVGMSNTPEGSRFPYGTQYLKIDNTSLSQTEVVDRITKHFPQLKP